MSHSQFHRISSLYLDMHGLIFETSIYDWQDQPGNYRSITAKQLLREALELRLLFKSLSLSILSRDLKTTSIAHWPLAFYC